MPIKPIVQALAVVWLLLFAASFLVLRTTEPDDSATGGLARIAAFLTWQAMALVVAAVGAFTTRYAVSRGIARVRIVGYVPLAMSVFLIASFIALMGFRFYLAPLFE